MAQPLNVVMICGSLRKQSYNASVMRALPAIAPPGMTLTQAPPLAGFPLYNSDLHADGKFPADVEAWCEAIRKADGVIVISPEFNWSIPAPLKNAIDWCSKVKDIPFKNKAVALQSASTGPMGGSRMQYHLRMALTTLEAIIFAKPEIFVTFAQNKINEQGELTDEPTRKIIAQQLESFGKFIVRVRD